ncbi:uncharacterized protein LOC122500816 [Leptopilina heterotoma]|uniref:uncharacterized protein LOC122500816 n=1 Tax=Leptopilina heterotoma TaxID=63436 RepID=UPI001CA8454C|nr:uncharacterized protein LOC122500816 [Leptopilina heterotoma]
MLKLYFILGVFIIFADCASAQTSFKRERFNVTLNELTEQCYYNGGSFMFDQILLNLKLFRSYRNSLLAELNAVSLGSPAEGDPQSIYWLNQICMERSEMKDGLRQLLQSVQNCLNVETRLRKDEEEVILENMLLGVCLQLEFERALYTQPECLEESMASLYSPTDECSLAYPNYRTVYTLEPIPITYSRKECSDFINAGVCRIDSRINCDNNLKVIIKHRFNTALELIYCDNLNLIRT